MKTVAVDTGGTFTDMVVLEHESGDLEITGDGGLRATGSRNYLRVVGESATAKLAK